MGLLSRLRRIFSPAARPADSQDPDAAAPVRFEDYGADPMVLVLEPSLKMARTYKQLFSKLGYGYVIFQEPEDFYAEFQRGSFDIVIVNGRSPDIDASDIVRTLKDGLSCKVPIVVGCSGLENPVLGVRHKRWFVKPITDARLGKVIQEALTGDIGKAQSNPKKRRQRGLDWLNEAEHHATLFKESGLSKAAFCRERKVKKTTFENSLILVKLPPKVKRFIKAHPAAFRKKKSSFCETGLHKLDDNTIFKLCEEMLVAHRKGKDLTLDEIRETVRAHLECEKRKIDETAK